MRIDLNKLSLTFGFSCIITGVSLGLFPIKEYKQSEIKAISQERNCLVSALYYEARGLSYREKIAVAEIILNRTKHKDFPDTICKVIHQPWQFSYLNNLKSNSSVIPKFQNIHSKDAEAYLEVEQIVDNKLNSRGIKLNIVLPNNAIYYHLKIIDTLPKWTKDKKIRKILVDKSFAHVYYSHIG